MTKQERKKLREAIVLIANAIGRNGGWHEGIRILMSLAGYDTRHLEEPGCHNCDRNVGAGCFATQQHPYDAGYGQPYCDGYLRTRKQRTAQEDEK